MLATTPRSTPRPDCDTCRDTGFVHLIPDSGTWGAESVSAEHPMAESCIDCRVCERCGRRDDEGNFARPFPECDAVCETCVIVLRTAELIAAALRVHREAA